MYAIPFDVAGPGLALAVAGVGLVVMCVATVVIIALEGVILWALKWSAFKRALLVALVLNVATTILGFGIVPFTALLGGWGLLIDFILTVLFEGGILLLLKRGAARENWIAALATNAASYLLVILPLYLAFGLLN